MTRKNKITITFLVLAILALITVIGLLWFFNSTDIVQPNDEGNTGIDIPATLPSASSGTSVIPDAPVAQQNLEAGIKAVASTFAERYGSFSNQANFDNLKSIRDLMTLKMKSTTDGYIAAQDVYVPGDASSYYGITSKALSVNILSLDEDLGRAEATVSTQRIETKITTNNPRVFYQDLDLKLVEDGDSWRIDSASWQ